MATSPHTTPKIALIGAGPVSLTLANILQARALRFTIFESSSTLRSEGGSLDLHPQGGQAALKEAGLWDQFVKHARPECDILKLVHVKGEVVWDENKGDGNKQKDGEGAEIAERPEIDRGALTKILSESLAPGVILFDKKLVEVVPSMAGETNKHDLHFADGSQETGFDIVVGGDGAWSKVRNILSDVKPQYSGISTVEVSITNVAETNPWLHDFVGAGSMFAFGEGKAVQAQRQGDGSIRSYASQRVSEDFLTTCGIDWGTKDAALRQYVERYFSDISSDLKRAILEQTDSLIPRTLYELPVGFSWAFHPGVTLIGDAAHFMSPFAGVGVNVGMVDAMMLAKEIVAAREGKKSLEEALKTYEEELFPRMKRFAQKTEHGKTGHFSENGAQEFADKLRGYYAAAAAAEKK
ncbi:FAD/NAD(P)-binding domain-containing protein [Amniculicola lignicola CBS 123094]|uniref:FAD/NAD(P)-binding domain-containing protein n=1 Tax=Amniculicola lignicola CBS 123094 TaxID=1392246 RepID=A0A6A5W795_9PLEO|nr:FAD/NAD(P)-binding domain-containing protein [Amniculicola lignicola CBS 123094]